MQLNSGLVSLGMTLLILGAALNVRPQWFAWFGKLPGDIRPQSPGGRAVPLLSLILIVVAVALLVQLLSLFFR